MGESSTQPDRIGLVKVTVNLTPTANEALIELATEQRMSRTDAINRALLVATMLHNVAPGRRFSITPAGGTPVEIYLV